MTFVIQTTFTGVRAQVFSGSRSSHKRPNQIKTTTPPTRVAGAGLVLAPHHEVLLPAGPGDGHQDAEGVQLPHPLLVAVLLLPDAPVRRGPADVLEYVELLVPGDAATSLGLHQVLRYVGELLRYSPFGVQCFISFTTLNESSSDENCFDNEK